MVGEAEAKVTERNTRGETGEDHRSKGRMGSIEVKRRSCERSGRTCRDFWAGLGDEIQEATSESKVKPGERSVLMRWEEGVEELPEKQVL